MRSSSHLSRVYLIFLTKNVAMKQGLNWEFCDFLGSVVGCLSKQFDYEYYSFPKFLGWFYPVTLWLTDHATPHCKSERQNENCVIFVQLLLKH